MDLTALDGRHENDRISVTEMMKIFGLRPNQHQRWLDSGYGPKYVFVYPYNEKFRPVPTTQSSIAYRVRDLREWVAQNPGYEKPQP